jgi:hypothetical protein
MGPPSGHAAPSPAGPRRRGTPKIVPVVMAAGLAVGTFCGLLFGVGTGGGATAAGNDGAGAAIAIDAGTVAAAAVDAAPPPPPVDAAVAIVADAAAEPAVAVKVVLTFKVVPAVPVEITVDGEKVVGMTHELTVEDGARTVKIVAKARGFRTHEKEFAVTKDMVVAIALKKRTDPGPQGPSGPIIDL